MRLFSGVLAAIGIGACSMALADAPPAPAAPPTSAASASAATPSSIAPASAPVAAASTSTAAPAGEDEQLDRHLRSEGYKVEMHGSRKLYCRKEEVIGTRLGAQSKTCATAEQLKATEEQSKEAVSRFQRETSGVQNGK